MRTQIMIDYRLLFKKPTAAALSYQRYQNELENHISFAQSVLDLNITFCYKQRLFSAGKQSKLIAINVFTNIRKL